MTDIKLTDDERAVLAEGVAEAQACGHCDGSCGSCQEEVRALAPVVARIIAQRMASRDAQIEAVRALTDPDEMERAMYRHTGTNEDLLPLFAGNAARTLRAVLDDIEGNTGG